MVLLNENILQNLKNKDQKLWVLIYREYKPMVINLVLKNSGSRDEAEDLFQNVMISLLENIEKSKLEADSNLKNYIYTLAINQWRSKLRRLKRNPLINIENSFVIDSILDEADETVDYHEKLDIIFAGIKEKCKKLMQLRYSSLKKSMDEIAQICGFSNAKSATSQLNKCMNLAKELAMPL